MLCIVLIYLNVQGYFCYLKNNNTKNRIKLNYQELHAFKLMEKSSVNILQNISFHVSQKNISHMIMEQCEDK